MLEVGMLAVATLAVGTLAVGTGRWTLLIATLLVLALGGVGVAAEGSAGAATTAESHTSTAAAAASSASGARAAEGPASPAGAVKSSAGPSKVAEHPARAAEDSASPAAAVDSSMLPAEASEGSAGAVGPGKDGGAVPLQEPLATIVVTATRTPIRLAEATSSVTVIGDAEIEARQAHEVLDVLREVPGLDVVRTGSRGAATQIFIRGADADQTLVLIDGVEVNSVTLGQFDFGNLTTDNVERVEVLRGSGGTLYGSQAVGGVVNIITRRGRGAPRTSVTGQGGSGSTGLGAVSSSGAVGRLGYSIAGSYLDTQGFRPENDDYSNGTAALRLDYDVSEQAAARLFFRYTNADLGLFNSNNFLAAPDPNARMSIEAYLLKGEWEQEIVPDLEIRLAGSYVHEAETFRDPPDAAETSLTTSDIPTGIVTGEIQANHYWRRIATTTIGLEVKQQMADVRSDVLDPAFELRSRFDESRWNVAGYAQEQLRLLDGALIGIAGVRVDGNEDFGTEVSPGVSLGYEVPRLPLRLKASYAEGFKAPTFNDLFFPDFGNPDLEAETSREFDVGLVASGWDERALLEVTGFDRDVENLIEGAVQEDGTFRAENRGDAHVRGVEVAPRVRLWQDPEVTIGGSYTRLFRVDTDPLLRRPKHRGAVVLGVAGRDLLRPSSRYEVRLAIDVVGDRPDVNPGAGFATDTNPAYVRIDLAAAYTFERVFGGGADVALLARVENAADKQYAEALGFRAPPVNVLAGVRVSF